MYAQGFDAIFFCVKVSRRRQFFFSSFSSLHHVLAEQRRQSLRSAFRFTRIRTWFRIKLDSQSKSIFLIGFVHFYGYDVCIGRVTASFRIRYMSSAIYRCRCWLYRFCCSFKLNCHMFANWFLVFDQLHRPSTDPSISSLIVSLYLSGAINTEHTNITFLNNYSCRRTRLVCHVSVSGTYNVRST